MATFGSPRFNLAIGLLDNNTTNYSRTISYTNTSIGQLEDDTGTQYSPDDIYQFATAVASLSGAALTTINISAQYPING